jgi:hypothetical protein
MVSIAPVFRVALVAAGLPLPVCAQMPHPHPASQSAPPAAALDDDAFCRANGAAPGSSAYVACRRDRDVAASRSDARMDRTHKNLAEDMLNGR